VNECTPSISETFALEAAFTANQLLDQAKEAEHVSEAIELARQSGLLQEMAGVVFAPPESIDTSMPDRITEASQITAEMPISEYLHTLEGMPFTKHIRYKLINALEREGLVSLLDVLAAGRERFDAIDRIGGKSRELVCHLMVKINVLGNLSLFWPNTLNGAYAAQLYEDFNHVPGGLIDAVFRDYSLEELLQLTTDTFEKVIDDALISDMYPEKVVQYKKLADFRSISESLSHKLRTFTNEFTDAKND